MLNLRHLITFGLLIHSATITCLHLQLPHDVVYVNSSYVCQSILNTSSLLYYCRKPKSICACKPNVLNSTSEFAVVLSGSPRTFFITYLSFKKYVLYPNKPDVVYVFQNFNHSNMYDNLALEYALQSGVAVIAHNSQIGESFKNYTYRKKRKYSGHHMNVDEMQTNHKRGGVIDMWNNLAVGNNILKNVQNIRKKPYSLILKSRPDLVYFTPLHMKRLLLEYKERDLLRPYLGGILRNGNYSRASLDSIHEKYRLIKEYVPSAHFESDEPPLFMPPCVAFGGFTDRLFLGPPRVMNGLLNEDIIKNVLTLNQTMIDKMLEMKVGPREYFYGPIHWVHGHGLEGTMRSLVNWFHIPLASLPLNGDLRFLWGILRDEKQAHYQPNERFISSYCEGHWESHWTDKDCVKRSDIDTSTIFKTSKLELGEELTEICHHYHKYYNISMQNIVS